MHTTTSVSNLAAKRRPAPSREPHAPPVAVSAPPRRGYARLDAALAAILLSLDACGGLSSRVEQHRSARRPT